MTKNYYSTDPKSLLVSIKEFYDMGNYLIDGPSHIWNDKNCSTDNWYYYFTSDKLIFILFGYQLTNFGMDIKEKLEKIVVAYRDGVSEYKVFDDYLSDMRTSKKKKKLIKIRKWIDKAFPKYDNSKITKNIGFEDCLINIQDKFDASNYKEKYIVIDTETNGIRKSNDDLLSISIFDPFKGVCYNRFFPLDLQPLVLNSYIHGITDKKIKNLPHWTQEEINKIIDYFDLKNATILSYSGGEGKFDYDFINNYCKRHNLTGFENLNYKNIKNYIPRAPFGCEGQLSKDNLCKIFKVGDIEKIHTSLHDCVLEWKLFDKLINGNIFFINHDIYSYNKNYIIPVSYLAKYPVLAKYAGLELKSLVGHPTKVFEYEIPETVVKKIKKFPTNISGITIENLINSMLNVEKQDNTKFLTTNKSNLQYIGSLESSLNEIPIALNTNGTISNIRDEDKEYINEINKVTKTIEQSIKNVTKFIKEKIFINEKILSQELVISQDEKVLALCDLSSKKSILEIKTTGVINNFGNIYILQ